MPLLPLCALRFGVNLCNPNARPKPKEEWQKKPCTENTLFHKSNTKLLFCYPHLYMSSMTKGGTMYNLKIKYKKEKILEHEHSVKFACRTTDSFCWIWNARENTTI